MTKDELKIKLESAERELKALKQLEAEIQSLKAQLNEVQEDEIPEFPVFENETDRLYYVTSNLRAISGSRIGAGTDFNAFHTATYATIFSTKCREIAMLMHCKWYVDKDYVPDWDDDRETKYIVVYSNAKEKYITGFWKECEYGNVYFSSREAAQKAADWMNKHINEEVLM